MMLSDLQPPTLYPPEKAEELAKMLTAKDESGWRYQPDHDPKGTGYSRIEVYDEDSEFVGYL